MSPYLAAFFGFAGGAISGIGFMVYLLVSSHRAAVAMVVKSPENR